MRSQGKSSGDREKTGLTGLAGFEESELKWRRLVLGWVGSGPQAALGHCGFPLLTWKAQQPPFFLLRKLEGLLVSGTSDSATWPCAKECLVSVGTWSVLGHLQLAGRPR